MSSGVLSNQKKCVHPTLDYSLPPHPCQDMSLDMIDMSPANCQVCHFKYFDIISDLYLIRHKSTHASNYL